jgi:hypothetical protein
VRSMHQREELPRLGSQREERPVLQSLGQQMTEWPQGELPVLQRTGLMEREGDPPPVQVLYSLGRMTVLLEPEEDSLPWLERTLLGPGQHQQAESPHSRERLHLLLE